VGTSTRVSAEQVRDLYLSHHENAKFWQDYSDFAFYRLGVSAVYFIGGFGVMGWISAEDYTTAKPDPLAEAAPGIIQHMNADHAYALRQMAGYYAGEAVDEAVMTAVDRLGFHLRLKSGDRIYGRPAVGWVHIKDPLSVLAAFGNRNGILALTDSVISTYVEPVRTA
jgi:heme iron utilization protein